MRESFSAQALADAVNVPDKETGSQGLTTVEVAKDVRARLDAAYTKLSATGKPFDINSPEGADANTLLGDLDRRSLYAVRRNVGGKFTQQAIAIADAILGQQQTLASGNYTGPTRLDPGIRLLSESNLREFCKRALAFLDRLPQDEKTDGNTVLQRASLQSL